jgi:hypothetical protein
MQIIELDNEPAGISPEIQAFLDKPDHSHLAENMKDATWNYCVKNKDFVEYVFRKPERSDT